MKASACCPQYFEEAFRIFERTKRAPDNRACKYCVSLLMSVFGVRAMAANVASDTLRRFITTMLVSLIDSRVGTVQDGMQLMKARGLHPWCAAGCTLTSVAKKESTESC